MGLFNTKASTKQKAWKWKTWHLEGLSLEMRMTDLRQRIDAEIGHFDLLIIEKPTFFGSEKGNIAAHSNYTVDLAAVAYYIAGWYQLDHRQYYPFTATQWKGSVDKAITARRFFRRFPFADRKWIDEHAIDAVMMMHFWLTRIYPVLPASRLDVTREKIAALI
jgi:hypothetical protein